MLDTPTEIGQALSELAARRGQDATTFLRSLVEEALLFEDFEVVDKNDPQERAEAIAGIQRGLDAFAAGRHRRADAVFANMQKRQGVRV